MPDSKKTPPSTEAAKAPKKRMQMEDIARLAGVATSTVSRALSGSELVNAKTRERIVELARSLNYSVNVRAQSLRRQQNNTVTVVVPYDTSTRQHLSDPFFLWLIGSIADALMEKGYDMLLSRVDAEHLDFSAHAVESGRAIGVILVGQWHHHDQLNEMALRGIPFVVWGAQLPNQLYCTVGSDNQQGGHLATKHLFDAGARRIAFVGDPDLPEIQLRYQGYLQAHREAGITPDPQLLAASPFVTATIQHDVHALLQRCPTLDGLFAASDLAAMAAIGTLVQHGKSVPADVAVVGYDDIQNAAFFHPPLTTIRQPIDMAGVALVDSLLRTIAGERPPSVQLRTELIARESA